MKPIRLIALDLDGTLLNSRGAVSEGNRAAVLEARARGVRVALVTGRRFRDVRPLALELDLDDVPVISHTGALTKHARTLETVKAMLLPLEAAQEVLRVGRELGMDAMVSDDPEGLGVLLYDHINEANPALSWYIAWSRRIHGDESSEFIRRVPSLEEYLDHSPVHIGYAGNYQMMVTFGEELKAAFGENIKVFATLYPKKDFGTIDVLHPSASKGAGVAAVAAEFGLSREEVMAVGDNFNDLEMLHYAGVPVAMGNAEASLRDMAGFHITGANDEDGVAHAIERFIFNNGSQEPGAGSRKKSD
jgi:Cof subfamily protein (haloacid dehalogenase superfamily)